MKKLLFLAAALCVFSTAALAQKAANYSGTWNLDLAKSKLDDRMRNVESMTWTVAQTDAELKITTATKRQAPPADAPARPGGGMGRGGGFGDSTTSYDLSGKESKIEIDGPNGKMPQTLKASPNGGKLQLTRSMTMNTQMGEMTMTTKETWELSADGKTLTVTREQSTPRGTNTSTMVFTKA